MSRKMKWILASISSVVVVTTFIVVYDYNSQVAREKKVKFVEDKLSKSFGEVNKWPEYIESEEQKFKLKYSFNDQLTEYIKKRLKRYRSDYSTVIVVDNNTAEILAAVGHEREGNRFNRSLPFSTSHPSASLFKIVTSAALLENGGVDLDDKFSYRGRGSTLYKYQLKDKKTRWTRYQTLKKAFAFSNNVIFGKAAQRNIEAKDLILMANKFGFNKMIMSDINLSKSSVLLAQNDYQLAELATGFNKKTMVSPVHAALMASIVANDGVMKPLKVVKEIVSDKSGEVYSTSDKEQSEPVISKEVSEKLKIMMEAAVKRGTARGSFRRMNRKLKKQLLLGGKTGSITGGIPYGKHDWFTAYAIPKDKGVDGGISICVLNINKEKWRVRSAYLAKEIIEYFYKNIRPINANDKRLVSR